MDQFYARDIYFLTFIPVGFLFLYFLYCISDKDITRVMVFFWGVVLIAIAGITAYQLMGWHPIAQVLAEKSINGKGITKATLNDFEQKSAFLLWFIPFFTGALGTNLISDALTKPLLYEKKFNWSVTASAFVSIPKALFWTALLLVVAPFLVAFGILKKLWTFSKLPRRWRVFAWRYRRHYTASNARGKFPWEPDQ